jgi:hypothetical protein
MVTPCAFRTRLHKKKRKKHLLIYVKHYFLSILYVTSRVSHCLPSYMDLADLLQPSELTLEPTRYILIPAIWVQYGFINYHREPLRYQLLTWLLDSQTSPVLTEGARMRGPGVKEVTHLSLIQWHVNLTVLVLGKSEQIHIPLISRNMFLHGLVTSLGCTCDLHLVLSWDVFLLIQTTVRILV